MLQIGAVRKDLWIHNPVHLLHQEQASVSWVQLFPNLMQPVPNLYYPIVRHWHSISPVGEKDWRPLLRSQRVILERALALWS